MGCVHQYPYTVKQYSDSWGTLVEDTKTYCFGHSLCPTAPAINRVPDRADVKKFDKKKWPDMGNSSLIYTF